MKKEGLDVLSKLWKEVDNEWKNCPYCGGKLLKVKNPKAEKDSSVTIEEVNDDVSVPQVKEKTDNVKKSKWRKVACLFVFVIAVIAVMVGISGKVEKTDIHQVDVGNLLGNTEEVLEKLNIQGLIKYEEGYAAEDSNTLLYLDNSGVITRVSVGGDADRTPLLCGVQIGMSKLEAHEQFLKGFIRDETAVDEYGMYEEYIDKTTGGRLVVTYNVLDTVGNMDFFLYNTYQ